MEFKKIPSTGSKCQKRLGCGDLWGFGAIFTTQKKRDAQKPKCYQMKGKPMTMTARPKKCQICEKMTQKSAKI